MTLGKHKINTPAVCGCVTGRDLNEMRKGISKAAKQGADLIELRIDNLREKIVWGKILENSLPTILTNRPSREGGMFKGKEEKRIELLLEGIRQGASCVDIEYSTPKNMRDHVVSEAKKIGASVLMSFHDFSETPPANSLLKIAKKIETADCDIVKIVTLAKTEDDTLQMLDFLVRVQGEISVPIIAFAMGEHGKITRFISPIFGAPIIYASVSEKTGPGQLDVMTMKTWVKELILKEVRG